MPLPSPSAELNWYQRLVRRAIGQAFTALIIPGLCWLHGAENTTVQLTDLRQLPAGTLGREIATTLDQHGLRLIPGYENHDLKHVLLGYGMTAEDELKLKAFLFGNGDHSLSGFGLLALALLTPELWPELTRHYRRGRRLPPITPWRLADYAAQNLEQLRRQIGFYEALAA